MDVLDYLRVARGRLWLLLVVPLVAGLIAAAVVMLSPKTYSASATLSSTALVGVPSGQFTGPQAASQFAAAYTARATGPRVFEDVSRTLDLPVKNLTDGLTVTQSGASSDMDLTYTSTESKDVTPTLELVNKTTLRSMFGLQVKLAKQRLDAAQAALDDAETPSAQQAAVTSLSSAQTSYEAARSQLEAAQTPRILFVGDVHPNGRAGALVRAVVPVVAAAFFLAVILLLVLEMMAGKRRAAAASRQERSASLDRRDTALRTAGASVPHD